MTFVDQNESDKILKEINPIKKDSGGSVANTMVGISLLGLNSFFCGKVRDDEAWRRIYLRYGKNKN